MDVIYVVSDFVPVVCSGWFVPLVKAKVWLHAPAAGQLLCLSS
jgi:hypothetical protein